MVKNAGIFSKTFVDVVNCGVSRGVINARSSAPLQNTPVNTIQVESTIFARLTRCCLDGQNTQDDTYRELMPFDISKDIVRDCHAIELFGPNDGLDGWRTANSDFVSAD